MTDDVAVFCCKSGLKIERGACLNRFMAYV
jgi:hypothetical protein